MKKIIGNSPQVLTLNSNIFLVAKKTASILITGETGTGKTTVAANIHELSERSGEFVTISHLDDTFIESTIFGHKKGAFTGANSDRCGAIKNAKGGTLFFDEIGELPMGVQVKLLRLLDSGKYSPLGSDEVLEADVRFIFATHVDLRQKIKDGKFREDLFYRINIIEIKVPALRERQDDVLLWIDSFFEKTCEENSTEVSQKLKADFLKNFKNHTWPGNLRELRNCIQRAVTLGYISDLPIRLDYKKTEIASKIESENSFLRKITFEDLTSSYFNPEKTILEMEKNIESDYLTAVNNLSHVEAAKKLGVSSSFCYKYKYKDEFFEKKINIILTDNISLKEILLHFKDLAIVEMSKHFPKMRKADLTKKIGVGISTYYRAIENTQSSNIYLGHVLETKDDILLSQETNISENNPQTNEEINTVTTFPFDVLKSQLFDFFEDYKRLQIELEKTKAKNKELEGALLAVEELIKTINR